MIPHMSKPIPKALTSMIGSSSPLLRSLLFYTWHPQPPMPAFIITSEPSRITLYTTCTIPQAILDGLRRDFDLGAHKGYDQAVALDISARTDLHGLETAEDVLRALEADGTLAQEEEGNHPFLIANEETVKSAKDGQYIVWYVESWAEEEDFEPDALEPSAELEINEGGQYNFASKGRFYAYAYV